MNYAERIAAGWKPKWGLYNDRSGMWFASNGTWEKCPTKRYGQDMDGAAVDAREAGNDDMRPRRYWVKPKAKPSLGQIADAAFNTTGSYADSWEKAAQAVAAELVRRMEKLGLPASAKKLRALAKGEP